jgi:acyl-CoA reductase-like NAD-dependent aldehyde dehydrogenase
MAMAKLKLRDYKMVIDGKLVSAVSGETMEVINPATGQPFAECPKGGVEDVDRAVQAALKAAPGWAAIPISGRSELLVKLAHLMRDNVEELAMLETSEQGSPIRKTTNFDIPQCAGQLEYYAGVGRAMTGETLPIGPWCMSMTVHEPLGVVGLITPWNFPALMVIWKLGAALITGNTCLVKPPSCAPLTTIRIGELALEAGFPPGVVNIITGPGPIMGEAMVTHPQIARIGFTGDTATGKRIAKLAADTVKVVGLELGGKNPFIVLQDANVDAAVEGGIFSAFFNSGQVCAAASRFYIHESIYDEFAEKFVSAARKLKYGDTMDMATGLGPVAYKAHRDNIEGIIERTKKSSAKLLLGGQRPNTPDTKDGFFVAPTIFGDCTNDMEIMKTEIFGPVVGLAKFKTPGQAIELANDSVYGLCASIWSEDVRQAMVLAGLIKAGTVWVNEHIIVFCETPWGGCKQSGSGKDLSTMALKEYTLTKHIYVDLIGTAERPWHGIVK